MNNNDFVKIALENNLHRYMNNAQGFPVLNEDGSVEEHADQRMMEETCDQLATLDGTATSEELKLGASIMRMFCKSAEKILEEDGPMCEHQLLDKILPLPKE